ncbi:unnamed protein product, partial [Nesidiocoris tenuis]
MWSFVIERVDFLERPFEIFQLGYGLRWKNAVFGVSFHFRPSFTQIYIKFRRYCV